MCVLKLDIYFLFLNINFKLNYFQNYHRKKNETTNVLVFFKILHRKIDIEYNIELLQQQKIERLQKIMFNLKSKISK